MNGTVATKSTKDLDLLCGNLAWEHVDKMVRDYHGRRQTSLNIVDASVYGNDSQTCYHAVLVKEGICHGMMKKLRMTVPGSFDIGDSLLTTTTILGCSFSDRQ
jgi:hypothetical protein